MDGRAGSCSYCGSTMVVTLHMEGEIVCGSCGAVLAEQLIDDSAPQHHGGEDHTPGPPLRLSRLPRGVRRTYRRALRRGHVVVGEDSMPYSDLRALEMSSEDSIAAILGMVNSIPGLARRRPRVKVGVAFYISYRLRGYSKSSSLRTAARSSGASVTALERVEKAYRRELENIIMAASMGGERV
ncbi:TFIIB-type zinc ribbon-containing protein [Aeropyrum pernix]|nr:transcription initiation factor IIB family protein [Aeropyrum pernix]